MTLPSWHSVAGASAALAKWIAGDRADEDTVEHRRAICKACPSLVDKFGSHWCGEPFEDRTGRLESPTCGCSLTKIHVAGEECPQAKWPAVDRAD